MELFRDRYQAGLALTEKLRWTVAGDPFALVIGLGSGGVMVAAAIAERLSTQLDVLMVQELTLPAGPPVGVMVSGGLTVLNEEALQYLNVSEALLDRITAGTGKELRRCEMLYRDGRPPLPVRGRTVVLADDGSASSMALVAAVEALKPQGPTRVVVAVPVASQRTFVELQSHADELVCIALPPMLGSPGMWYSNPAPISDERIRQLLEDAAHETKALVANTY